MPLPQPNSAWPPPGMSPILAKMAESDAWFAGDPERLDAVYSPTQRRAARIDRPSQYQGGVAGTAARMIWGKPVGDLTAEQPARIHVPLAADICQASADLLFADPPQIKSPDSAVQKQLDQYLDDGLISTLASAGEIGAALGGTYLRATQDQILPGRMFTTKVDADAAWPEFRYGRLVAVTFWWVTSRRDQVWTRHLERHEIDAQGNGVILHGLYSGTPENLGRPIPLTEDASTTGIAVDAEQSIPTNSPDLAVRYVPNVVPNRMMRHHPIGQYLGRSDYDGLEPEMSTLDGMMSLLWRDLDMSKGRVIVPDFMLTDLGAGFGMAFNSDRTYFAGINQPPGDQPGTITVSQFQANVSDKLTAMQQVVEDILRSAGYSTQTFGENEDGGSATATEVNSRDRRTTTTRDRKIRMWKPELTGLLRKQLAMDGHPGADFTISFPEAAQASPLVLAQTAQALFTAQAASTETLVRGVHPDWDDTQVKTEVAAIKAQTQMEDPSTFTGNTDGQPPPAFTTGAGA